MSFIFNLRQPCNFICGWEICISLLSFFFAKLQLKKFWVWAEIKTGLCWGRKTAKASDKLHTNWILNNEHKKNHQFYYAGHTVKVIVLYFVFSMEDPICLKLVWMKNQVFVSLSLCLLKFGRAKPDGTPIGETLYFTVYPESSPNTASM